MATSYPINPMYLLGRTFDFIQLIHCEEGAFPVEFRGRVLAVQVPAPGTDVEWSVLIEQRLDDRTLSADYASLDSLSFEWPSISSIRKNVHQIR